jgi:hypothetical protein
MNEAILIIDGSRDIRENTAELLELKTTWYLQQKMEVPVLR